MAADSSSTPHPSSFGKRDLARLITGIENGDEAAMRQLREMYPHTGRAHIIGVTGAPGSGKSTLVAALTKCARAQRRRVAILSIDPSSPFSGGAILGDRIRMRDLSGDEGVFIRSMASRGALGGLASAAADVAVVLDVSGFDLVLIETVGAGQADIDVVRVAETVIVVEAPGMGDDVQAIKAGVLEVADVVVVNKADHVGAEATVAALQAALELGAATSGHHGFATTTQPTDAHIDTEAWRTPILKTIATSGDSGANGVEALLIALDEHRAALISSGEDKIRRARRAELDVLARLRDLAYRQALGRLAPNQLHAAVTACATHMLHPADAAQTLL